MSSQLVDINADGRNDVLLGSFSGTPQVIFGVEKGYDEPSSVLDAVGQAVLISAFWNHETDKWDDTTRCESDGHCTSASAVDWDNDGDLDLILGDYYGGRLFLRLNQGSATEPKFAAVNLPIEADRRHITIPKGLAATVVTDWNNDGRFDLICGGAKGGAFLFENTGQTGKPQFASSITLLEPTDDGSSFIANVPAYKGQPTQPGSSIHLEACDYDGDGDIDLVVGARSSWKSQIKKMTDSERADLESINDEFAALREELANITKDIESADERATLTKSKDYRDFLKRYSSVARKRQTLSKKSDPTKSGDFVWLLRRK